MDFFEKFTCDINIMYQSLIEVELNFPTINENQFLVDICKNRSTSISREEFQFIHEKFVNYSTIDIILFLRENIKL
jgi:hypothetical protein